MLLDSLAENSVRWAMKLTEVEAQADGTYNLHFVNGHIETGLDIVIGAKCARSYRGQSPSTQASEGLTSS